MGAIFVGLVLIFSGIVAPKSINPQKFEPYECGIPTEGVTWLQFNVGYYLFGLIFFLQFLSEYSRPKKEECNKPLLFSDYPVQ